MPLPCFCCPIYQLLTKSDQIYWLLCTKFRQKECPASCFSMNPGHSCHNLEYLLVKDSSSTTLATNVQRPIQFLQTFGWIIIRQSLLCMRVLGLMMASYEAVSFAQFHFSYDLEHANPIIGLCSPSVHPNKAVPDLLDCGGSTIQRGDNRGQPYRLGRRLHFPDCPGNLVPTGVEKSHQYPATIRLSLQSWTSLLQGSRCQGTA